MTRLNLEISNNKVKLDCSVELEIPNDKVKVSLIG
jgi:hypothetical protein